MGVASLIFGLVILFVLNGPENAWIYPVSVPLLMVFSKISGSLDWKKFLKILSILVSRIPKVVLESLYLLVFSLEDTFEVLDIELGEEVEKVLSITITPLSVVFMSEGDRLHVHVLRRSGR